MISGGEQVMVPGNGLVITGFTGDEPIVYPGDRFQTYLTVQNMGDKPAEDVLARISRFGSFKPLESLSRSLNGGHPFMPPNIETNTRGDIDQIEWEFEVPYTKRGYDYIIAVDVSYDYSSESTLKTQVISRSRYRAGAQIIPEITKSQGPVQIDMRTENTILDINGVQEFKLYIDLLNVGDGILNDESSDCALGPVGCIRNVDLYVPKGDAIGKLNVTGCAGSDYKIIEQDEHIKVEFRDIGILHSGSTWLSCNINATADLNVDTEFERSYLFKAYARYRYQIRDEFPIQMAGET